MKKIFLALLFFSLAFAGGFFFATRYKGFHSKEPLIVKTPKELPIRENKNFVIIIPSYNNKRWVERNLRSVAEQDYQNYRVVYIDDCSTDGTGERVKVFASGKLQYIQNEIRQGAMLNLYKAIHDCKDDEIIVLLDGDDWFAHEKVLNKLNHIYQNPDVWLTYGQYLDYPGFTKGMCEPFNEKKLQKHGYRGHHWVSSHLRTFYAGLFKKVKLGDFFFHGKMIEMGWDYAFMLPMLEMANGKYAYIPDVLYMYNRLNTLSDGNVSFLLQKTSAKYIKSLPPYAPVQDLWATSSHGADLVVFSYNRPMQLYAFLESLERYVTGFTHVFVIYRADPRFESGYEKVQDDFVGISFLKQETPEDFKPMVLQTLFENAEADYVLFAVDDIIVKDEIDLQECVQALEETGAYGFYLKMGNHIDYCYTLNFSQGIPLNVPLKEDLFAWHFEYGKGDWGYPNTLDMTLYRKADLKKAFHDMPYHNPNKLEGAWSNEMPSCMVALYYGTSKVVNVPTNQVNISSNRHMQSYSPEELAQKFEQGLKINITPFFQVPNRSVHSEYSLEFVPR